MVQIDHPSNHHPTSSEVATIIRLLGRKWAFELLNVLLIKPQTFADFKKSMKGISGSVLADLILEFMDQKIVVKRIISQSPKLFIYFLSNFTDAFRDIRDCLADWVNKQSVDRPTIENVSG